MHGEIYEKTILGTIVLAVFCIREPSVATYGLRHKNQ